MRAREFPMSQHPVDSLRRTIETVRGTVEYASIGEGDPVLVLHGMPGGFDQGILGFDWIADAGLRLIAPSRPGYLGTPLSSGESYQAAADAYAALLDGLHIDQVSVVAISGGGPSAYLFAIRHPDRIKRLVTIDCIAMQTPMPADFNGLASKLYFSDAGQKPFYWLARKYPRFILSQLIKDNSHLTTEEINDQVKIAMQDQNQVKSMLRILKTMGQFPLRKAGVLNDIKQFITMAPTELAEIRCPTLIVHGTHDNLLLYQAVFASNQIAGSQCLFVMKGSHFCAWIHPDAARTQKTIIEFLKGTSLH